MSRFDYFVIFAEMRTGSNFLENNLNAFPGVVCHGEVFNPAFIGAPDRDSVLGETYAARVKDPHVLLHKIKTQPDVLAGFRFFNDHEPRILDAIIADPRCAKIVLTRNPIDSYVSFKIARATGQWRLTNVLHARREQITFDGAEFVDHVAKLQAFQVKLLNALQVTGQTAFYVDYEDLQDLNVINGLAQFLGRESRLEALDQKVKKQNPEPLDEKVVNPKAIGEAIARLDRFNLARTPNFEPRRAAPLGDFTATSRANLLFMPITGSSNEAVRLWMQTLDGGLPLRRDFTASSLSDWKLSHRGHRAFTVLSHPLQRAHAAFCRFILPETGLGYGRIREHLAQNFGMPLPPEGETTHQDDQTHAQAFEVFLAFLKANLSNQTAIRIDNAWASQSVQLQSFTEHVQPDMLLREERLETDLALFSLFIGFDDLPEFVPAPEAHMWRLAKIVTPELQELAFSAYTQDFTAFGFEDWHPPSYLLT